MNTAIKIIYLYIITLSIPYYLYSQKFPVSNINKDFLLTSSAVIRNDETIVKILSRKKMEISEEISVTVLNKSKDEFSNLYFPYDAHTKIKKLQIIIYDKDGKKIKTLKRSDFLDISSSDGNSLYTDDRYLYYKYYPVSYPYTVEISTTKESSNTVFIKDYVPLSTFNVSVENSSYTVLNTSGIALRFKKYTSDLYEINEEKTETGWKYFVNNIPSFTHEPLAPSLDILTPKVSFSLSEFSLAGREGGFSSWDEFGKWMYSDLLRPRQQLSEQVKKEVRGLINNQSSDKDKIKALYQFMQDRTRYINVSIGIGGWQPMNATEVYMKGYGDCKGLTNYMQSILHEIGIKAYYTIIYSGDSERNFDKDFPKMAGNHVILSIPVKNDTIWLENTSQNLAFNHLTSSTANRNALVVSEEGAKIITSKKYNSIDNTENINFSINIEKNGNAALNGSLIYKGLQYSNNLFFTSLKSQKLQEYYKDFFSELNIKNYKRCTVNNDRDKGLLTTELELEINNYAKIIGNEIYFDAVPFKPVKSNYQKDSNRKLPLEISFGYKDEHSYSFTPPQGYTFTTVPGNILAVSEFGFYSLNFHLENEILKVTRKLYINKGRYNKDKFNEYVKFRNTILKNDQSKVNIIKKS
ncbi:DUF3857 domain-containing protein [Apibacter sp. HY039]|uniref:DUF3857 domain-containing protein n=1 Tax=Apibacter sp. HY039 TaxID=2501476 RepID=UPI000FEB94B9|nr:DUF3857 domain-containing protein [Apibacter sp. HY039]